MWTISGVPQDKLYLLLKPDKLVLMAILDTDYFFIYYKACAQTFDQIQQILKIIVLIDSDTDIHFSKILYTGP